MRRLVGANILFSASLAHPTYKRVANSSYTLDSKENEGKLPFQPDC